MPAREGTYAETSACEVGWPTQVVISCKHHKDSSLTPVITKCHKLNISSSITQLGLSISSNLTWKPHINSNAKHASQKLGFPSGACSYFLPSRLLIIYQPQIRPSLEYCSHFKGGAPKSFLHLLDKVQSKTTRLINNPNFTNSLQSLSIVISLQIFPFSTVIFTDIALWKSRILLLTQ